MHPFAIFIIILIVIWTLSGIATWMNKQKEAERRRMIRAQMGQSPDIPMARRAPQMVPPPLPVQKRPRISQGLAARCPDVLLPPAPVPQRPVQPRPMQQRPAPQRQQQRRAPVRLPGQPRPVAKPARARQVQQQAPPMVLQEDEPAPTRVEKSEVQAPPTRAVVSPRISAETLSSWLKPATLNQQFLLTEIFQPPLALRDPSQSRI